MDGAWIMRNGVIPGRDLAALSAAVQQAAETMWAGTPKGDWAKRPIDQLSPESFPAFKP